MRKGFIVGRLFSRTGPKYRRFGDVGIAAVGQKQGNTPVRGCRMDVFGAAGGQYLQIRQTGSG